MTPREKVTPGQNIFRPQHVLQLVSSQPCSARVNFKNHVLKVALIGVVVLRHRNAGHTGQFFAVLAIVPAVDCDEFVQAFQGRQAHRRRDLVHFAVRSHINYMVVTGESEIRHEPDFLCQFVFIGDDCAPLKRIDELGRVKTENLRASEVSDHLAAMRTAKGVGGIEQHAQVMLSGHLVQRLHSADTSPKMDADDAGRARCDHAFDFVWVDVVGGRIYVAEHRCYFLPLQRVGGRDKGEGGNDYLALKSCRANGKLQRDRAIANCDAMLGAYKPGDLGFKLLDISSIVRKPPAIQHVVDSGQQPTAVPDIRASDVEGLAEGRRAAEQGQVLRSFLSTHCVSPFLALNRRASATTALK